MPHICQLMYYSINDLTAFSISVLVPLLHTSCQIDLNNKRILRINTQSWDENVPSMNLVTEENILDSEETKKDKEFDGKKSIGGRKNNHLHQKKFPSFLGSEERSLRNTWELVIIFDSDHSCFLADQHIMSRRFVQ